MEVVSIGNKFLTYGGTAANVYNDIRSLDASSHEWKIVRQDLVLHDFPARFGHSMGIYERYLVIFGGCGPYQHKLKKRNCFQDVIMYDTQTGCYVKFDGGPASLAAEIEDLSKTTSLFASEEPNVMKQRISQIATAENAPQIE